jgi:hypothetical protein
MTLDVAQYQVEMFCAAHPKKEQTKPWVDGWPLYSSIALGAGSEGQARPTQSRNCDWLRLAMKSLPEMASGSIAAVKSIPSSLAVPSRSGPWKCCPARARAQGCPITSTPSMTGAQGQLELIRGFSRTSPKLASLACAKRRSD